MEVCAFEIQRSQFFVGDDNASGVIAGIESGANFQPRFGCGVGNQLNDDFMTHQRSPTPIAGDV